MKLKDQIILITGASSGIGSAAAELLASEGATVIITARRMDRLNELQGKITSSGGKALALQMDVTQRASVNQAFEKVIEKYGRIDVLVNNAGVMPVSYIDKLHVEEWEQMIDVNLKGLLYCIAAAVPSMKSHKKGHIVNISSVAGRRVFPGFSVYNATKFGVTALSEAMRMELTPSHGIKVTSVEPGAVTTELTHTITDQDILESFQKRSHGMIPLQPQDIAEAILYAISQPDRVNVSEVLVMPKTQA